MSIATKSDDEGQTSVGKRMKLLKLFSSKLPMLRKTQLCEVCEQSFACEIALGCCWCGDIKLSEETRQELRSKYKKCLCRACLERAEAKNAKSEEQKEL